MTYCLALLMDAGLVFAADSRTNAGVDNVSTYRKLRVYQRPGDRVIVVLSAGNLAITQAVAAALGETEREGGGPTLYDVSSIYEAAQLLGDALRRVHDRDAEYLKAQETRFSASFIIGGQVGGKRMRLFQVYAAGNFIEATPETPYFQIGETKYGKPIIERVHRTNQDLVSAVKCAIVSLDSTIRSNISVAPPIDLLVYRRDSLKVATHQWMGEDDGYFQTVRGFWGAGLRSLFSQLPDPPWADDLRGEDD